MSVGSSPELAEFSPLNGGRRSASVSPRYSPPNEVMISPPHQRRSRPVTRKSPLAIFAYVLSALLGSLFVWKLATTIPSFAPAQKEPPLGSIEIIGQLLFTRYLFVFEATSVLLFVAVIGAVVLAKQVKMTRAAAVRPEGDI